MNSIFVLHARAAQIMLHLLNCRRRDAAKKPVIHTNRREHEMANSHTADFLPSEASYVRSAFSPIAAFRDLC